jgi:hypothetical protein
LLRISKHRDTTVSDKEVELETGSHYRESGLVFRHTAATQIITTTSEMCPEPTFSQITVKVKNRHEPVIETTKEAVSYRHAWWLIATGLAGGNQSDFGCSRAGRLRESLSLSWWNKENRVLILPILENQG